jgi:Secretion system C-terminal sorting domain
MKHKILIHFFLTLLFIFVIGQQRSFSQGCCSDDPKVVCPSGTIHVYNEIPYECICVLNKDGTEKYCTKYADSNGECYIKVVCGYYYSVWDPAGHYPSGNNGFYVGCDSTIDVTIPPATQDCHCSGSMKVGTMESVDFRLDQNYPNPFNPMTKISYYIAQPTDVKLTVYDLLGNEIALLVSEFESPGAYSVDFDGFNLSSGVYIYKIKAGTFSDVKRLLLIK